MLLEVRKLVFSDDLFQQVVLEHCAREEVKPPQSRLQGYRIEDYAGGASGMVLEFETADVNNPHEVHLNEQFTLSALISACKKFHVPLPRSAAKKIQKTDQGIAMVVSMHVNTSNVVEQKAAS